MFISKTRIATVVCGVAIALSATYCEAQSACCGVAPAVVTYARPYAAARIAWVPSYGISSSCNPWVPGSCGYAVYRPVRACAYTPACNACSSCASPCSTSVGYGAAYSPGATCTTVLRTRQVPGQPIRNVLRILLPPYRPIEETVCSTPQVSYYPTASTTTYYSGYSNSCGSCAPTTCGSCYSPARDACSACGSACSSCPSAACCGGTTTTPSCNGCSTTYPSNGSPSTYKQDSQSESQPRLMPTPETNTDQTTFGTPKRIEPKSRTAMQPLRQKVYYRTVSLAGSTAAAAPVVDVGGWRASSD